MPRRVKKNDIIATFTINEDGDVKLASNDEVLPYKSGGWALEKWIPYGSDNLFPDKFLRQLSRNPIYNRVCSAYAGLIKGGGLSYEGSEIEAGKAMLKVWGVDGKFLEKAAWDVAVLNTFSCQVIRDENTLRIAKVNHIRASQVRCGLPNEYDEVTSYWLARDWSVIDSMGNVTVFTPDKELFIPKVYSKWVMNTVAEVSVVYNPRYSPVMHYYPLPDAEANLRGMELSNLITEYQISVLKNTITNSMIITIPRQRHPDDVEESKRMEEDVKAIQERLAGAAEAGKAVIIFYDINGKPPTIQPPVQDSNDKRYLDISSAVRGNLLTGLGVISPELFGIPSSGGFSSQSDMLITANDLTYYNVIQPLQDLILEVINSFLEANNVDCRVSFVRKAPVNRSISDALALSGVFSTNEIREHYGFTTNNSDNNI